MNEWKLHMFDLQPCDVGYSLSLLWKLSTISTIKWGTAVRGYFTDQCIKIKEFISGTFFHVCN